ncbi:MAG: succinate-semialdehyde dehydrogenase/glutarate-semialdehyde dehydrogenase, partial [Chitinophagales bacterium]
MFKSINPYTNQEIATYPALSDEEMHTCVEQSQEAYSSWGKQPLKDRCTLLNGAAA